MSYKLTLTASERKAFDWVGYRYASSGDVMADLIRSGELSGEWDSNEPITFYIPESTAWEMERIAAEDDYLFPCFAESLVLKMHRFLNAII